MFYPERCASNSFVKKCRKSCHEEYPLMKYCKSYVSEDKFAELKAEFEALKLAFTGPKGKEGETGEKGDKGAEGAGGGGGGGDVIVPKAGTGHDSLPTCNGDNIGQLVRYEDTETRGHDFDECGERDITIHVFAVCTGTDWLYLMTDRIRPGQHHHHQPEEQPYGTRE